MITLSRTGDEVVRAAPFEDIEIPLADFWLEA